MEKKFMVIDTVLAVLVLVMIMIEMVFVGFGISENLGMYVWHDAERLLAWLLAGTIVGTLLFITLGVPREYFEK